MSNLVLMIGKEYFAIDTKKIVEVIPYITLRYVPAGARGAVFHCNYRGVMVPGIDLQQALYQENTLPTTQSRILLIKPSAMMILHALLVPQIIGRIHLGEDEKTSSKIINPKNSFLGRLSLHESRAIQELRLPEMLPMDLKKSLQQVFQEKEERV